MLDADLVETLNDAENDMRQGIEQLVYAIKEIHGDVENLKVKTSRPDKITAQALLEYIGMEDCKAKKNMEVICGREIRQYMRWLEFYCDEQCCTQEQALKMIIDGDI